MTDPQPVCNVEELVERHYELLYRYAYRLSGSPVDAEDLAQQTFLIAQAKIGQLRRAEHARAWLFTILRNAFLKSVQTGGQPDTISLEHTAEPSAETEVEAALVKQELQSVLNELPEEFRTPLVLYYFQEFSYREIAGQLEIPLGTVMSRLARGKKHLRGRLMSMQPTGPR